MIMKPAALSLFASMGLLLLGACAAPIKASKTDINAGSCVEAGRWANPKTGNYISANHVIKKAAGSPVVLLGEVHTAKDHHLWHLQTVAQIYAANPHMILGFEAFPRRVQPVLDKWVAGELSEKDFIDQSDWNNFWRFDANLYMGLFNFARMNRVPMVALNVDRALIGNISKNGWKNIKQSERLGISNPAKAAPEYIKMLETVFAEHKNGKDKNGKKVNVKNNPDFNNFVDAQLAWDRAFAQAIADTLEKKSTALRNPVMVNIIGRGHTDYGFGVSNQLKSLGINNDIVLSPWDDFMHCDSFKNNKTIIADAVFGIKGNIHNLASPKQKLGVYIEQGEGGVLVKKVAEKSIGEKAGIKKGDLIINGAGKKLKTTKELIAMVNEMAPGTWLPISIMRNGKHIDVVAKFKPAKNNNTVSTESKK